MEGDKRAAQLAAAEKRAVEQANRGMGARGRGEQLSESARKQELIGRITEVYRVSVNEFSCISSSQVKNKEVPVGLNLASVEQLPHHLESVRKSVHFPGSIDVL